MASIIQEPIALVCRFCAHSTRAVAALAGRTVPCPLCERSIVVPRENPPKADPEASDSCMGPGVAPLKRTPEATA